MSTFEQIVQQLGSNKQANRLVFVSTKLGYIYLSNQKCACTTIRLMLYRAELDDPEYFPKKASMGVGRIQYHLPGMSRQLNLMRC